MSRLLECSTTIKEREKERKKETLTPDRCCYLEIFLLLGLGSLT